MTSNPQGATRSNIVASVTLVLGGLIGGTLLSGLMLYILTLTHFPAFGNSNFIRSLTTFAQVVFVLLTVASMLWAQQGRLALQRGEKLSYWRTHFGPGIVGSVLVSGLVTVSLALPLAATKLYLHGITGDQAFRTQYLTRLTDTALLQDMAYADLPPFYPAGWFWLGGRFANMLGLAGWEAFKPWSIISMAAVAAFVTACWALITRPDKGLALGTVTALFATTYGSPEPYAGIVAMVMPLVFVLAWQALNPIGELRHQGWGATILTMVVLGLSATTYTLFTAIPAVAVVLTGIGVTIYRAVQRGKARARKSVEYDSNIFPQAQVLTRRYMLQPLLRTLVIGVGSLLIAFIAWAPYLLGSIGRPRSGSGLASHYLPADGATFLLPMFKTDATGLLCLIGLIWLIVALRRSRIAQAFLIGIVSMYLWTLASMSAVVLGSTLLGFRVALPLTLTFALAGICGIIDSTHRIITLLIRNVVVKPSTTTKQVNALAEKPLVVSGDETVLSGADDADTTGPMVQIEDDFTTLPRPFTCLEPRTRRSYTGKEQPLHVRRTARTTVSVVGTIAVLIGIGFAQDIPMSLSDEIQMAYIDTDGDGQRADRFPAGIPSYYPQVHDIIMKDAVERYGSDVKESEIVVLTTEEPLLAYYPFRAFQAISPHYANPLGLYNERNVLIEKWALSTSPEDLLRQLDASPFAAPTAFVFRREGDNLSLLMSEDVYPNQPNVHDYQLSFSAALFDSKCFAVHEVGPLTVITRLCDSASET
ncbi:MAG: arabinofuranosyltransferase [Lawsonella sp.]